METRTFESETCSRCGGTGKHSFCQMYRDRCFKCAGKGYTYTTRGAAALAFLRGLMETPVLEIKPGDKALYDGKYRTVLSITPSQSFSVAADGSKIQYLDINFEKMRGGVFPDMTLPVKGANHAELVTKALDYQDSLTKAGKPRKSKKTA